MKKIIIVSVAIIIFSLSSSVLAQQGSYEESYGICEGKTFIGVETKNSGFRYRVEADRFITMVINRTMFDPTANYCLVPSAGKSDRSLKVSSQIQRIGQDRIEDSLKNQGIRAGAQTLEGLILGKLPYSQRRTVKSVSRSYTTEPRIVLREYQVSTESIMCQGKRWLWKGSNSRVFKLKFTTYPGDRTRPDLIEFVSYDPQGQSDTVGKLQPYSQILEIPQGTSNLGHRYEEFMRYISALGALDRSDPKFEQNFKPGGDDARCSR